MSKHGEEHISVGEDSFLDTAANLVGIMIILVVLVGSKTKLDAHEHGKQLAAEVEAKHKLAEPVKRAQGLQQALVEQAIQIQEHTLEAEYRRAERGRLLEQVTLARQAVDAELNATDETQRKSIEKQQKLEQLESQLKKTNDMLGSAEEHKRPKIVLEHLPTPMAKTVFGKELHIRLQRGQVTVVPWDQLIQMLKNQLPLAAQRNASRGGIEETLGPVGGFMMRYKMAAVQGGFELDRFEIETTPDNVGEPLENALSSSGRLRLDLASRDPAETVVTVWVYPDSFDQFRVLKAALFDEGFLCAARPLPEGMRIGASPSGSRSSAQ
jgi:hypothetical protein